MAKTTSKTDAEASATANVVADDASKGELAPANGQGKQLTEIVTKPGTAHVTIYKPTEVEVYDMDEDEDTGLTGGDVGGQDKRLPILRVLQSGSPQVKQGNPARIPGAKEGDIFNTATGQIYDGERGLYFVAAHKHLKFPEYIKREEDGSGGGFLGIFEPEDPVVRNCQAERMQKYGNLFGPLPHGQTDDGKDRELVETYYVDGIYIIPNEDGTFPGEYGTMFNASMAYSSTFIRSYNQWKNQLENMTYIIKRRDGSVGPALATLWTHVWHIRTVPRPRGTLSWMVPRITLAEKDAKGVEREYKYSRLDRNDYLYKQAEDLRMQILEGGIELNFDKDQSDTSQDQGATAGTDSGGGTSTHDDIPFGNA